jgi:uncharacterized membrane protein
MLRAAPSVPAIVAFYLIYASALTALVLHPALERRSAAAATWRGAVFGLGAYATYDLTTYAIMKDWPLTLALADLAWGTIASATAATIGYIAASRFGR